MAEPTVAKDVFGDHNKIETADMMLASQISRALDKHYPNHLWAVNVNSIGGVVTIKNFSISFTHGYLLKLAEVQNDPSHKKCIMAAGEILERGFIRRGAARIGEKATKIDGVADKYQPKAGGKIIV
jgi:hypothetical protein